jgi:hypothetical protein
MSTKCTMSFQLSHCLEYGLIITGRDVKKAMSCVQCNFCVYSGRSGDDVDRKRMQIEAFRKATCGGMVQISRLI